MADVVMYAADYLSVPVEALIGRSQEKTITLKRQMIMYYLSRRWLLTDIGIYFGGRDHSTVTWANKQVKGMVQVDAALADVYNKLTNFLNGL